MDRVARFNVLAMSGRAVEASGDVDVILLDKTGTITYGNRLASSITPAPGVDRGRGGRRPPSSPRSATRRPRAARSSSSPASAWPSSASPAAPATRPASRRSRRRIAEEIPFRAETRTSGVRTTDGGADPQGRRRRDRGRPRRRHAGRAARRRPIAIADRGATPLALRGDGRVLGLIELKDTVKEGLVERFAEFRRMGIRTVMITGDNPRTAATIAREAGVDDFIAAGHARGQDRLHPQRSRPRATSWR